MSSLPLVDRDNVIEFPSVVAVPVAISGKQDRSRECILAPLVPVPTGYHRTLSLSLYELLKRWHGRCPCRAGSSANATAPAQPPRLVSVVPILELVDAHYCHPVLLAYNDGFREEIKSINSNGSGSSNRARCGP